MLFFAGQEKGITGMSTSSENTALQQSTRRQKLLRYLQALYPPGTPGELLAYVKYPFQRVFGWPHDLETFADRILALDEAGCETWLTINTLDGRAVRSRGKRTRGCEDEVTAVVSLAADIDGPKPGHDYPTQHEIYKALLAMPRYPSLIAVSGQKSGGLHVYWLLDQPYVIRGEADRRRIKDISRRWQALLRSKLGGRDMDSTYDLVRVLRPIGSTNRKYGTVVLEAHDLDPAMKAKVEADLGASLDEVPYDRDSIDELESALPAPPPPVVPGLREIALSDQQQPEAVVLAAQWLSRREPAIAATHGGGGGDAHTYDTAVSLVHGFGLSVEAALPLICQWNQYCVPTWSQDTLLRKLQCADAWQGDRPRGWQCRNSSQTTDLEDNCDISTQLMHCPTPKIYRMQALDTCEAVRLAIPCGNRRTCQACQSNWVVRNYKAIYRTLADASQGDPAAGGEKRDSSTLYAGEVDDAGLRAACKYLERGKKRHGASAHYVAILRPGGRRLLITLAPYGPGCQPVTERPLLNQQIYQALEAVPLDGKRGVTHSRGWLGKEKRPRRYAIAK